MIITIVKKVDTIILIIKIVIAYRYKAITFSNREAIIVNKNKAIIAS